MKTFLRLVSFARPFRSFVPLYTILALFATVFSLANFTFLIPLLNVLFDTVDLPEQILKPEPELSVTYVKEVFNFYFHSIILQSGRQAALGWVCWILFFSVLLSNLFKYLSQRVITKMRTRLIFNMRNVLYKQLLHLNLSYYHQRKKGDMISVMSNDLSEIDNSVVNALIVTAREPFTLFGFFVLLMMISVKLTLFSLVLLPVSFLIIAQISRRLRRDAGLGQKVLGSMMARIEETIGGIRIIQAFGAQGFMAEKFLEENAQHAKLTRSVMYKRELASPLSEFMGVSVIAMLLYYGGLMVIEQNGELTGAQFITYLALYSQVLNPAKSISNAYATIQRGIVSGERVFEILHAPVEVQNLANPVALKQFRSKIEYKSVCFGYNKEDAGKALYNVNLTVHKGETVALVGPSGSGKSTLADLLPRFYDVDQGCITIDNIPLQEIDLADLRSLIGIVSQEAILFNDNILNNIAFGRSQFTEAEIHEAAKVANAHDFISQLPEGYQTHIGDRGVKLSGGQRQRLSIARAVLGNPQILILDEATSALDTESERLVQDAIQRLMKNRTVLVIAHRLSTIKDADKIVVLDQGKIVQQGKHDELINSDGVYQKLCKLQSVE